MANLTETQKIVYSLIKIRNGAWHDMLVALPVEEARIWAAGVREYVDGLRKLPKKDLVAKLGPASELHERQLMKASKAQLADRIWDRRVQTVNRNYGS